MVRLAASYLSQELGTDIRIQGFDFSLFKGLVIEKINVKDLRNNEIFSADKLSVSIGKFNLRKRILNVKKVSISHGVIQLITYKGDSALNLQFLVNYFASTNTTDPLLYLIKKSGK